MKRILGKTRPSEIIMFILSGGFAALVNIFLRYILTPYVGYNISIIIAFICAMTTAWFIVRQFVFSASSSTPLKEYTKFSLVNLFALIQVWSVSIGLDEYIFPSIHFEYYPETVAHVIGVLSPVLPSYLCHKYFTFGA